MAAGWEAALRRQRALTLAALALLVVLAWGWLVAGAGMGMSAQAWLPLATGHKAPGSMSDMPGMPGMAAPGAAAWSAGQLFVAVSMWWVMMVAMMLPSAAPVILLYARAAPGQTIAVRPAPGHFLAGYLAVWGLFSLVAAGVQDVLQLAGLVAPTTFEISARWLTAALLVAGGLYQLSPLKEACLANCRSPAAFLTRHYRAGRSGAFRMGAIHGAFCLGCCWLLMALLFVGGVMNLAWIALLAMLVAAEKLLPGGRWIARFAGLAFVVWGGWVALS